YALHRTKMHSSVVLLCCAVVAVSAQDQWQRQDQQQFDQNQNSGDTCCEEYCYVRDEDPYINFATATAYDSLNRRSGNQHVVPDCTPVQFWTIIRHGTRLPNATKIVRLSNLNKLHEEVSRNYEQRNSYPDRGRLCREDYDLFRRWRWNDTITPEREFSLTSQGMEDMKLLARRYKSKYPQLLQQQYDEKSFYFQYTNTERIQTSYQAYIEGLFGSEAYRIHANTNNDDKLVKPYENCKKWEENLEDVSNNRNEYMRYIERSEFKQMERDIFRRLGFRFNLNSSTITDIYDLCRYEKAWNVQQRSAWCIAFNKNQLKMLEYAEDLRYYYKTGYGNKMSERIGCGPIKDMYERFDRTVNGNSDGNKATFLFTHSETILSLITALGIARDNEAPTADNFYQQARRNWKTSVLDPFASNLAATLYEFILGAVQMKKYRVMFFLNEVPVEFPECSVGLCNWSAFQQKFQSISDNCNVEGFCSGNSASSLYLNYLSFVFAVLVLYFRF
ncbi:hypothetical protein NQ317_005664, partial [Molorchus minor]